MSDTIKLAQSWAEDNKDMDNEAFASAIKKITDTPHKIFYILGKSASGKDTIFTELLNNSPLKLGRILMYTTRPMRDNETPGKEYEFVLKEAFLHMFNNKDVAEYRTYYTAHGAWTYFTPVSELDLSHGSKLGIGTLASYTALKQILGDKIIPIYIEVDNDIRFLRAFMREQNKSVPDYFELCRRYVADEQDFSEMELNNAGISVRFQNNSKHIKECKDNIIRYIQGFLA